MAKDAAIVITFSEPMNKAATQAAYQSADVPAAQAVLNWNADGRVLAVTPNAELEYALGATPAVEAKRYAVSVTTAAEDQAGNELEQDFMASFTTFRRIKLEIPVRDGVSTTPTGLGFYHCHAEGHLVAGDGSENLEYRGWLFFSIADLPSGITSFESAALTASQVVVFGMPYGSGAENLGSLLLEHTNFSTVDETVHFAPPLRELGVLASTNSLERKSANVLDAIKDDYANREPRKNQSQYRFRFTKSTDGDWESDAAYFNCGPDAALPTLSLTYLIP